MDFDNTPILFSPPSSPRIHLPFQNSSTNLSIAELSRYFDQYHIASPDTAVPEKTLPHRNAHLPSFHSVLSATHRFFSHNQKSLIPLRSCASNITRKSKRVERNHGILPNTATQTSLRYLPSDDIRLHQNCALSRPLHGVPLYPPELSPDGPWDEIQTAAMMSFVKAHMTNYYRQRNNVLDPSGRRIVKKEIKMRRRKAMDRA